MAVLVCFFFIMTMSSSGRVNGKRRTMFFNKLPDLSQSKFPTIADNMVYDMIVIGSGVAGESCAVRAAQMNRKVGIIERKSLFGGPTGLTSKAVRESAKRIASAVDATDVSKGERRQQIRSLWKRLFPVLKTEAEVLQAKESRDRLTANKVDIFVANAEFSNRENTLTELRHVRNSVIRISRPNECIELQTKNVCIATGSRPNRPSNINGVDVPWHPGKVVCSTEIANLPTLPNAVCIFGGGVIAVEYATVFAKLGVGVTLICREENFLPFLEKELRESLKMNMKNNHVLFVADDIDAISLDHNTPGANVRVSFNSKYLKDGQEVTKRRILKVDIFLYSGGRDSNSDNLGLEAVGVNIGKYGRILVDSSFKTTSSTASIYAVGDVIGPPMLASSAQAQGRRLAENLFAANDEAMTTVDGDIDDDGFDIEIDEFFSVGNEKYDDTLFGDLTGEKVNDAPLTLWSIPEVSSVGLSYEKAIADSKLSNGEQIDVYQGYAFFKDTARGRLSGTTDGFLKVVAKRVGSSYVIIGVHIFGEGANELIQMGALLIHSKTSLHQVSRTPFAAVTLTGLFQMACDDCLRKIGIGKSII